MRDATTSPVTAGKSTEAPREFGGALGAAVFITLSHALLLYLWMAWRFHDGAVFLFVPKVF